MSSMSSKRASAMLMPSRVAVSARFSKAGSSVVDQCAPRYLNGVDEMRCSCHGTSVLDSALCLNPRDCLAVLTSSSRGIVTNAG